MKDKLKKLPFGIILLLLIAIVVAGYFWRINQRYTVTQGEQNNGIGTTYGYKIENYAFTNGIRITIWEKIGLLGHTTMQSVFDLPELSIDKVDNSEWIKSNGAIYLNLQITYHDSVESTNPTKIIYDFHTGQMYVTSELTLWRMWSEKLSYEDWMSESDFNDVLAKLQK